MIVDYVSDLENKYQKGQAASDNFIEQLPVLLEIIRKADFIALDTEFSGLNVTDADHSHRYETLESAYQKYKHVCSTLHAFQFGLCAFNWDEVSNTYVMRPLNFYVWPSNQELIQHGVQ